jgi:hypothetical protein
MLMLRLGLTILPDVGNGVVDELLMLGFEINNLLTYVAATS